MLDMKHSGIEWIGSIPKDWKINRLKYDINCYDGKRIPIDASLREEGPYPYWGAGSVMDYVNDYIFNEEIVLLGEDGAPFFDEYRPVAFLINEPVWVNNHIHVIKGNKNIINKYLMYFLNIVKYDVYINGSIINKLTQSNMNNINITLPKLKEQQLIAKFLDSKIGKIDDILKDINKQVELLNDYKKALITETVTKGLNPNAEMKDSGIDWIRSIPKHWSVNRINNICKLKGRIGWQGLTTDEYIDEGPYLITGVDFSNGSIDWNNCEHVSEWRYDQAVEIQIKENDLLITKDGTVGKIAIVQKCPEKATLNSGVLLIRSINNAYINKFLYYILYSNEFWQWFEITNLGATTITHLYQNVFAKFLVAMPNIKEQQEIVDYLDGKCEEIDTLIKYKQEQIEKMKQYKKSLIYEYVTGKKRVKGAEELYG